MGGAGQQGGNASFLCKPNTSTAPTQRPQGSRPGFLHPGFKSRKPRARKGVLSRTWEDGDWEVTDWGVQPPGTLAPLMQRQTSSDQLKPSLHSMTCARCNHGFCWRCLKSWKPSHKDYYNCSAMVRGWACQRPSQPRQWWGSQDKGSAGIGSCRGLLFWELWSGRTVLPG